MWCSCCSPSPSSTSCSRTDVFQGPRAARRSHRRDASRRRWRSSSSTRRTTPTRASSRRSSTSTCRWRSWRCAASWPAASSAIQHLRTATARGTCAPTWRSTCRSSSASACSITGAIWAQGLVGPLVGVGRAGAGLVPGRLPPLLRLLPAALLDRGPGAPGALLVGVRDRRRARSCRSTSSPCGWPRPSRTRACCRRPAAACPARCASRSSSASSAMALLFVTLWKLELTAKHASMQLKRLRRSVRARGGGVPDARRCRSTRPASTSPAPTSSSSR